MKNKESLIGRILFWIVLLILFIYMTVPFYWAIVSSLKTESQLMMTPGTFIPRDPVSHKVSLSFQNYKAIFQNPQFLRGILNSVQVALTVTFLGLLLGSFSAFAMGKLRFSGKNNFPLPHTVHDHVSPDIRSDRPLCHDQDPPYLG